MINKPIQEQVEKLIKIVSKNPVIKQILDARFFPKDIVWYLGAGGISQSVWNFLCGNEINFGIKDYDLVYFDDKDIGYEGEDIYIKKGKKVFEKSANLIEIRNQARVHLWFEKHFGYKIAPLKSCEEAINSWPTTATTVGINKINGKINVYAPYGLNDLFGMVVRPNKLSITKEVYEKKVDNWIKKLPNLKVITWGNA